MYFQCLPPSCLPHTWCVERPRDRQAGDWVTRAPQLLGLGGSLEVEFARPMAQQLVNTHLHLKRLTLWGGGGEGGREGSLMEGGRDLI